MICAPAIAHAATLQLVSSAPANNDIDVSRADAITLQFSTALSPYSVRADTVTLNSAAGSQKVSLNLSGTNITVRPLTPLLPWTTYTLAAQSLVGNAGEQLAQPVVVTFKTRDAVWQVPLTTDRVAVAQGQVFNQATAVNNKGVRFVVWPQSNGIGHDIWAFRHLPGETSSSAPALVASLGKNNAEQLQVFVDDNGNAFVTWVMVNPNNFNVPQRSWANRFVAGSGGGWGVPQAIDGYAARSSSNLHLMFDHAGNALVIWQEWDCCDSDSRQSIVVNHYTQRTGWSAPIHLDDSAGFFDGRTKLAIDDHGNAYAAWSVTEHYWSEISYIKVSHSSNFTWSAPQLLASASMANAEGDPALAVNPRGEAFLMWADDTGLKYAHADELGRWGVPISIEPNVYHSPSSMVFLDSGIAFAAFRDGVKMFRPDKGWWDWTHPLLYQQTATTEPRIVADKSGNALVAWAQYGNSVDDGRTYAKRYRAGSGWLNPVVLDTGSYVELEDLFLDSNGSASAAWSENNEIGTSDMRVANFK